MRVGADGALTSLPGTPIASGVDGNDFEGVAVNPNQGPVAAFRSNHVMAPLAITLLLWLACAAVVGAYEVLFLRFDAGGDLVSVARPPALARFGRLRSITSATRFSVVPG